MAGKKGERAGWRSGAAVIFGVRIWGSPRVRANALHLMPWQAPIPLSRRAGAETAFRSRGHTEFPDGHPDSIPHDSSVFGTRQGGGCGPRRPMSVGFGAYRPAQGPGFEHFWPASMPGLRRRCPVAVETGTKRPDSRGVGQLGTKQPSWILKRDGRPATSVVAAMRSFRWRINRPMALFPHW